MGGNVSSEGSASRGDRAGAGRSVRSAVVIVAAVGVVAAGIIAGVAWATSAEVLSTSPSEFIAGTGTAGCPTAGNAAATEQLNYPWDVLPDSQGNVYTADYNGKRIRKVAAASGVISGSKWKVPRSPRGTCYRATVTLADYSTMTALFIVK